MAIRPVVEEEIDLLDRHLGFGDPAKHRERLGKQQSGEIVYLIAWDGGVPVGHVLLKWQWIAAEPWAANLEDRPNIGDLFVATPNARCQLGREAPSGDAFLRPLRSIPPGHKGVSGAMSAPRRLPERRAWSSMPIAEPAGNPLLCAIMGV